MSTWLVVDWLVVGWSVIGGINPNQDGLFSGLLTDRGGGKICHAYPTVMKLGNYTLPKEDPKNI